MEPVGTGVPGFALRLAQPYSTCAVLGPDLCELARPAVSVLRLDLAERFLIRPIYKGVVL